MLLEDKSYKLAQKYSEAHRLFQYQYLAEVTELNIFSFDIVEETVVKQFLRDIK